MPETTEAMDEQEKFMASTASELSTLAQQIASSQQTFEALQSSQCVTEEEESEVFWGMRRWPNKLAEVGLQAWPCCITASACCKSQPKVSRLNLRVAIAGHDLEVSDWSCFCKLTCCDSKCSSVSQQSFHYGLP